MRHSRASEVTIALEVIGGELQLRIDDNGRGFTHQPPDGAAGLGLKIMRYRAEMLGGDLMIETCCERRRLGALLLPAGHEADGRIARPQGPDRRRSPDRAAGAAR